MKSVRGSTHSEKPASKASPLTTNGVVVRAPAVFREVAAQELVSVVSGMRRSGHPAIVGNLLAGALRVLKTLRNQHRSLPGCCL